MKKTPPPSPHVVIAIAMGLLCLPAQATSISESSPLSSLLKPGSWAPGSASNTEATGTRMGQVFEAIHEIEQSGQSSIDDALATAYANVDGVPEALKIHLRTNIMRQYRMAAAIGLLTDDGHFQRTVKYGRDSGEQVFFEHIVPASIIPEFSNSLANLRVVIPSHRSTGEPPTSVAKLDAESTAAANRFLNILKGGAIKQASPTTPAPAPPLQAVASNAPVVKSSPPAKRKAPQVSAPTPRTTPIQGSGTWNASMAANPGAATSPARIHISAQKIDENLVAATITNRASYPTEVQTETSVLIDEKHARGKLTTVKKTLRLLPGEAQNVVSSIGKAGDYLGWLVVVSKDKRVVRTDASADWILDEFMR